MSTLIELRKANNQRIVSTHPSHISGNSIAETETTGVVEDYNH